uniref:G-protein coupled receptors family 1 profile domain-containing protein n=1 Tax=Plectus sambesii TaxID=2011161 RepID=A0A914UJZ2_9BILA
MRCLVHSSDEPGSLEVHRSVGRDFSCHDMETPPEPHDVFPPVLELTRTIMFVIFAQTLILTVGLCGCASTFTYIRRVSRERCTCDQCLPVLLLIFCLNDTVALLNLPAQSVGLTIGHWIFGNTLCRLSLVFENGLCDTFSTFLILFLIFYLRAMGFRIARYLRNRTNLLIAASLLLLTVLIHLPVWFAGSAHEIIVAEFFEENSSVISSRVRYFHCSAHIDDFFFLFFNVYMVIGTYIVPVVLGSILLYRTLFHATDECIRRLAAYSSILLAFHLLCLCPQRLILPAYKISGHELKYHLIENLPNFCAALKWIIYWSIYDCIHLNCQLNSNKSSIRLGERRLSELKKRNFPRERAL